MHWLTHNFQSLFKAGQLLCVIVLDSASSSSPYNMASRLTRSLSLHITCLQVSPNLTTTSPAMASPDPWLLSQDDDFLLYKGLLYVPNNQDVQLDILCSHHDHHLAGHLASLRQSRKSNISSTGPGWFPSSPTTFIHAQSVITASPPSQALQPHQFLLIGE